MEAAVVKTCKFHGELLPKDCYISNSDKHSIKYRCKACCIAGSIRWNACNNVKAITRYKQRRIDIRIKVLKHYSNSNEPFCECCKVSNLEFLALDHKDGGGTKHRQQVGKNMYAWALKNNYPPMFRVLCHNCNTSIGIYGYCPHKQ